MKNIIITGSSGMIGNLILKKCLERADVKKVTIINRKKSGIIHPKLNEIIHSDFLDYSSLDENLKDQDVCFYCIGVYTGQVSRKEFATITIDYTKAFAEALRKNNMETTFCFLSGMGADSSEKSNIMFARDKGIAENFLLNLKFDKTFIFRPGYIYPVEKRKEPNLSYSIMRFAYKHFLSRFYPEIGVTSEELADAMIETGMNGGKEIIYENKDIRKITIEL